MLIIKQLSYIELTLIKIKMNFKTSVYIKLVCICFLFHSINAFAQIPVNQINKPEYRISRKIEYQSRIPRIPDVLNDTTSFVTSETRYTYSSDKLVKFVKYDANQKEFSSDSIIYITADSAKIVRDYHNEKREYSVRIVNYNLLLKDILNGTIDSFTNNENSLDNYKFYVKNGRIEQVKVSRSSKYPNYKWEEQYFYNYFYNDENKIEKIVHGSEIIPVMTTYYIEHLTPNHYIFSTVIKGHSEDCCLHYYFNDEGYLIKSALVVGSYPSIIIYEYEKGPGNSYFTDMKNILLGEPIVY